MVKTMGYPKILQIEPTNRCNFNCIMCIRHFWETNEGYMKMELYNKIAEEAFPNIERVTLYGEGEPLVHPKFDEMVKVAKEKLSGNGSVFFITNGSLLTPDRARKLVLDYGLDEVVFSVDTTDFAKLSEIRKGIQPLSVFRNLEYVASLKKKSDLKLGISTVLMKSNYRDLPNLVMMASDMGIDYISVSFVVPYNKEMAEQAVYSMISRESYLLSDELLGVGDDKLVLKAVYEAFFQIYGDQQGYSALGLLRSAWSKAESYNVDINPIMLSELRNNIVFYNEVQKVINESRVLAKELGIKIDIPDVFQPYSKRICPYAEREAMYVRWDGKVAPCMNYAYTHRAYVNGHERIDKEVIFADLNKETVEEAWEKMNYKSFRIKLTNMNKYFPWCGDCPFSSTGCWFVKNNDMDCYGNEPTCNECLYSMGLAKCLI